MFISNTIFPHHSLLENLANDGRLKLLVEEGVEPLVGLSEDVDDDGGPAHPEVLLLSVPVNRRVLDHVSQIVELVGHLKREREFRKCLNSRQ